MNLEIFYDIDDDDYCRKELTHGAVSCMQTENRNDTK